MACLRTRNRPDARLAKIRHPTPQTRGAEFQPVPRPSDYQFYRNGPPDRTVFLNSMPIYIGAAMIAVAILLSTLITGLTSRYVGIDGPTDENMWLVDRLTGSVYRCQSEGRGKASCEPDIATGSLSNRSKAPKDDR